jgi:hypothetical protein
MVMAAKLTKPTHKIAIKLLLVLRELYHLQFSLQATSPETFRYTLLLYCEGEGLSGEPKTCFYQQPLIPNTNFICVTPNFVTSQVFYISAHIFPRVILFYFCAYMSVSKLIESTKNQNDYYELLWTED